MTFICHWSTLLIALTTIMNGLAILYMRNRFDELYCRINFLEIREEHRQDEIIQYRHELFKLLKEVRERR